MQSSVSNKEAKLTKRQSICSNNKKRTANHKRKSSFKPKKIFLADDQISSDMFEEIQKFTPPMVGRKKDSLLLNLNKVKDQDFSPSLRVKEGNNKSHQNYDVLNQNYDATNFGKSMKINLRKKKDLVFDKINQDSNSRQNSNLNSKSTARWAPLVKKDTNFKDISVSNNVIVSTTRYTATSCNKSTKSCIQIGDNNIDTVSKKEEWCNSRLKETPSKFFITREVNNNSQKTSHLKFLEKNIQNCYQIIECLLDILGVNFDSFKKAFLMKEERKNTNFPLLEETKKLQDRTNLFQEEFSNLAQSLDKRLKELESVKNLNLNSDNGDKITKPASESPKKITPLLYEPPKEY